mgnify:CR=1 FL=1
MTRDQLRNREADWHTRLAESERREEQRALHPPKPPVPAPGHDGD